MRRWLLIAMLLVLPLQMVWAAAAPYCAHESKPVAAKHFGHHEHEHQGSKVGSASDDEPTAGGNHFDCQSCHLGAGATLLSNEVAIADVPHVVAPDRDIPRYQSHTPPGPERPNIADASHAARFGGGVASGASPED